jgi:hypothetical protein
MRDVLYINFIVGFRAYPGGELDVPAPPRSTPTPPLAGLKRKIINTNVRRGGKLYLSQMSGRFTSQGIT